MPLPYQISHGVHRNIHSLTHSLTHSRTHAPMLQRTHAHTHTHTHTHTHRCTYIPMVRTQGRSFGLRLGGSANTVSGVSDQRIRWSEHLYLTTTITFRFVFIPITFTVIPQTAYLFMACIFLRCSFSLRNNWHGSEMQNHLILVQVQYETCL